MMHGRVCIELWNDKRTHEQNRTGSDNSLFMIKVGEVERAAQIIF